MQKYKLKEKPYLKFKEIVDLTGLTRYTVRKVLKENKEKIYKLNTQYYLTKDICEAFKMDRNGA